MEKFGRFAFYNNKRLLKQVFFLSKTMRKVVKKFRITLTIPNTEGKMTITRTNM